MEYEIEQELGPEMEYQIEEESGIEPEEGEGTDDHDEEADIQRLDHWQPPDYFLG
jgi:hypothetical protein